MIVYFKPVVAFWVWFAMAIVILIAGVFITNWQSAGLLLAFYSVAAICFIIGEMTWACEDDKPLKIKECFVNSIHNTVATPVIYIMLFVGWGLLIMAFAVSFV